MDTLDLDFTLPLRSFRLELALAVGRETFALVGPSGAGKTSVLRAVAGLVRPERGRIALDERVLFDAAAKIDRPPEERRVGFVFQEYALFPHMTVEQNVAYAGHGRAAEVLERFRIAHLAKARPGSSRVGSDNVSGWRAPSPASPTCSCWTSRCRRSTHTRARACEPNSGASSTTSTCRCSSSPTTSRMRPFSPIAWLCSSKAGYCRSERPAELIASPSDVFVASFTGANLFSGRARPGADGLTEVTLADGTILYSVDEAEGSVDVAVYPWEVSIAREATDDSALNHVRGAIISSFEIGNRARVQVGAVVAEVTAASVERLDLKEGDVVVASFKATATRLVSRS